MKLIDFLMGVWNFFKIIFVILLIMGIGSVLTLLFLGYSFDAHLFDQTIYADYSSPLDHPLQEIQEIATTRAKSHNYSLGEMVEINGSNVTVGRYACDNFSRDLISDYEARGYKAQYCRGDALWCNPWEEDDESCGHAWVKVEIYIEATSGRLLDSERYRQNYIEESCEYLN